MLLEAALDSTSYFLIDTCCSWWTFTLAESSSDWHFV